MILGFGFAISMYEKLKMHQKQSWLDHSSPQTAYMLPPSCIFMTEKEKKERGQEDEEKNLRELNPYNV